MLKESVSTAPLLRKARYRYIFEIVLSQGLPTVHKYSLKTGYTGDLFEIVILRAFTAGKIYFKIVFFSFSLVHVWQSSLVKDDTKTIKYTRKTVFREIKRKEKIGRK